MRPFVVNGGLSLACKILDGTHVSNDITLF